MSADTDDVRRAGTVRGARSERHARRPGPAPGRRRPRAPAASRPPVTRRRRWPCGCARSASTSSSGSSSCGPRDRRCASWWSPTGRCRVLLWGPPGSGKTTIAGILSHSTAAPVRGGLGDVGRREGGACGHRRRPQGARPQRHRDRAVRRRGAPVLQGPAGCAAAGGGEPLGDAGRRDHREPVLLGDLARCCRARCCSPWSRSPTTTSPRWSLVRWPTRADSAGALRAGPGRAVDPGPAGRRRRAAGAHATWRQRRTVPSPAVGPSIDVDTLEAAVDRAAVRYDRDGDQHYDVISAFIKSIRGSDVDAGLHYLARMLEAGEDPRFVARRLMILASEDVGMADPQALPLAVAAAQTVQLVGLPEAALNLAHARHLPGAGAEVERGDDGDRGGRRGRARGPDRRRARRRCATPTTARPNKIGHGAGLHATPTTTRAASSARTTRRHRWRTGATTGRGRSVPSATPAPGGSGSGRSSAARATPATDSSAELAGAGYARAPGNPGAARAANRCLGVATGVRREQAAHPVAFGPPNRGRGSADAGCAARDQRSGRGTSSRGHRQAESTGS